MSDEGVLDPWVADWIEANPLYAAPFDTLDPEILPLARGPIGPPPAREVPIDHITDEDVDGIPIRIYRHEWPPTGLIVYFHGGGFCIGSIGLMDNVARELANASGAVVVSVGYRLAPESPYPAGLDDCETVTRWAIASSTRFDVSPDRVLVAGESAGGNLAAALSLRLRDAGEIAPAGQILIYPGVAGSRWFPSMDEFDGLVLNRKAMETFWGAYSAGRDLDDDPYAAPLAAPSLKGLPPALVLLGGCDLLRDEGRAYAGRLRDAGVPVQEETYAGQPHGFVNHGFPAAARVFDRIGAWSRDVLTS
jgi:acetyl esterase